MTVNAPNLEVISFTGFDKNDQQLEDAAHKNSRYKIEGRIPHWEVGTKKQSSYRRYKTWQMKDCKFLYQIFQKGKKN